MPSRSSARPWAVAALLGLSILSGSRLVAGAAPDRVLPTEAQIHEAIAKAKADPNLATERTIRTLDWVAEPRKTRQTSPAWVTWLQGLFGWLDQSARWLVYLVAIVFVVWLAAQIARLVASRRARDREDEGFAAPTHVRDLDIRPETLPDDIGAAARALWDRGERRACLALLYRGLLSRLAHVHRVPIRDSTTEGDCLALAGRCLAPAPQAYAVRLVSVWQQFVYGHEDSGAATIYALCDEFAAAIDAPPAPSAGGRS